MRLPKAFNVFAAGLALALLLAGRPAAADQTHVAVAANFTGAAKEIAAAFAQKTGHEAVLSFGASGQFYAQITQGAPFQVFLSADEERPRKLVADGLAPAESRFTYAIGKLVLWSRTAGLVTGEATLRSGSFAKIAIANPAAAPYGAAAIETMKAVKLYEMLQPKIVQGNSIAQTFQFADTGNAELGFVALSQVIDAAGSRWVVPQDLYTPIRQDAVLLAKGVDSAAAEAFLVFLRSPEARAIIERYGYAFGASS
ncbi:molybdate ABC transporter substrate-binding protein [Aquabacter spiritensis]|uniref:Molybdate transport system substrate-binding protein n=1 Tax=Aquabacter spiritensis TaxID=933073 RepID=A0A4R3M3J4_9HYPH|nr:molybdate ABC transporter substrate-binding protein [Aquabacter spiritensis]TCT06799.1 molybdate transport system substrate-binding protein [Aquabacter spiritensis]